MGVGSRLLVFEVLQKQRGFVLSTEDGASDNTTIHSLNFLFLKLL
jgi:hypothetical protein